MKKVIFMENTPLKIYFAGDLFDAKDLGGNLMLASAIGRVSRCRYQVMLPQNGECEVTDRTAQNIRNADFELLFTCDCIVANFDGTDLDSGTVVEFCFAKMIDMPAVLLRTDFRNGGDHDLNDGDPWNLMCSHYPRTETVHVNGMVRYHECMIKNLPTAEKLEKYYESIAAEVVEALDRVVSQKSWLKPEEVLSQYQLAVRSMGGGMSELLPDEKLQNIVSGKKALDLYS